MKITGALIMLLLTCKNVRSQDLPSIHYTAFKICYTEWPDTIENWQKCKINFEMDWKGDHLYKIIIKTHTPLNLTIKKLKREYTKDLNTHGDLYIAFDGATDCYVKWEIYDKAVGEAVSWLELRYPKYSIKYLLK